MRLGQEKELGVVREQMQAAELLLGPCGKMIRYQPADFDDRTDPMICEEGA